MKNGFIFTLFYILGLVILTFGISLTILADLGIGPWDALFVALASHFGLTVGSWIFIIGFLLIFINGYLLKKIPDFSALITMFLIGSFIDVWLEVVFIHVEIVTLPARAGLFVSGITCIAIGVSSYLQANFAKNPIDNLMLVFHLLTGKSLSFSKTTIEISILILAFLIGGPIGVGTIVVAIGIGPLIQFFYVPFTKLKQRICPTPTLLEN